jgi:hypothetical protein
LFITAEAHETWTNERVNLSSLATNDNCQIGFKMTDYYGYGVGLDDIQISGYKYAGGNWAYSPAQSFTFTNLNPNTTYSFYMISNCDGEDGSVTDWFYFTTEGETTVTQTIELVEGWNWISSYIEMNGVDGLDMFKESLGANGLYIQNGLLYTESWEEDGETFWYGSLDEVPMTNETMYMVQVAADCTVTLTGELADPAAHPITINPGWNWIGFPCNQTMSIEDAFANFPVADGDAIMHGISYSDAFIDGDDVIWYGGITQLEPGQGFMYFSNSNETKTLIFGTASNAKRNK